MHEKLKSLEKSLSKEITKLAQKGDKGESMTPKAAEVVADLTQGLFFTKVLCLLEEAEDKGIIEALGKMLGGKGGKQQIGFMGGKQQHEGHRPWGALAEMVYPSFPPITKEDHDMEMRRGRRSRSEMDADYYGEDWDVEDRRRRTRSEADVHDASRTHPHHKPHHEPHTHEHTPSGARR